MTECATPPATPAADKTVIPMPDIRAGAPAGAAGLVSPTGLEIKAKIDAEKAAEELKAALTVTIEIFPDGSRKVDVKTVDGNPVALGRIRDLFRECKEHYDDRLMAHMVKVEVSRAVTEAARATKDRNLMAKLFHALR